MESGAVFTGLRPHPTPPLHHYLLGQSRSAMNFLPPLFAGTRLISSHPQHLQRLSSVDDEVSPSPASPYSYIYMYLQRQLDLGSHRNNVNGHINSIRVASPSGNVTSELADIDWDNLGFGLMSTDYMYMMKCSEGESFSKGELQLFGKIELSPSAAVLNYGQGLFEGLKAYRRHNGNILLFRPEENAIRLSMGAERMCMPSPTVEQFMEAVRLTVLANERWIPPPGKGSLYIRPLLIGSGAVLGLAPAPEYTFLIYVSPVGNYFK
ncbi:Branched-chain-amino-acid aminotransferase, mitochondrial [Orobanche minor]